MSRSTQILALMVLIGGCPSFVVAQRASSIVSAQSHRDFSMATTASRASAPRAWSSASVRNPFSSVSILPNRSAVTTKRIDPGQERHFSNSFEQQPPEIIPIQVISTPFATESRVPIAPLLGARLQLNVSMLNLRNGNVMLGPTPASEMLHAPAQARSAEFYGFGVSIPLGRDSQVQTSNNLMRSVMRIVRSN